MPFGLLVLMLTDNEDMHKSIVHERHLLYYRSIMQIILLNVIVAVSVTDQRVESSEIESSRTKRLFIDSTQQSQIKGDFDGATHIFVEMNKLDFDGVTVELIGSVSSFLDTVGPFVGLVLSLFSGPSPEYQLLKKLFKEVENRSSVARLRSWPHRFISQTWNLTSMQSSQS